MPYRLFIVLAFICAPVIIRAGNLFEVNQGVIRFYSDAPRELIKASSDQMKGVLDIKKKTFAFKVNIVSFMGFNSPLQQEHFNENYMETPRYPQASYAGRIIEDIDFSQDGEYNVRAKGKLKIHGIEQERIVNVHAIVRNKHINIECDFIVPLADHNIKVPRLVYDKLATEINVSVSAILIPVN